VWEQQNKHLQQFERCKINFCCTTTVFDPSITCPSDMGNVMSANTYFLFWYPCCWLWTYCRNALYQGSRPAGRMWPARSFCAAGMRLGNFQIINIYVAKRLEKRCREIIESKLNDTQCGFCPDRSTTDHISLSSKISRNLGYAKDVFTCFVDLEKAYDRVPCDKLCGVLREYGVDGRLLLAVKLLHSCSDVCVRVGRAKLWPFIVRVGLRQGCVLSLLLFIVYNIHEFDRQSHWSRRGCHSRELQDQPFTFADNLTLLASSQQSSACTR